MKLPSEKYFISVQTKEDYYYFLSTGLLWELEPLAPFSWEEHLQMVDFKKKKDYYDSVKVDNYEASCKLEEGNDEGFERSGN